MQALLDNGDEVLIPSPDYPLWTAAVSLAGVPLVRGRPESGPCLSPAAARMAVRRRSHCVPLAGQKLLERFP